MAKRLAIPEKFRQDVITLLEETRNYIAKHPKQWTQNRFGSTKGGESCSAVSPEAKQFCALGFAINRAADLFGYEVVVVRDEGSLHGVWVDTEDGGDSYNPGDHVYRLSKDANRIYNQAQRALDKAVEGNDSIIDFNDGVAKTSKDVVQVYDRAIELVEA